MSTNSCCLLAETHRSCCTAPAACGHAQQRRGCTPLSYVLTEGAVSRKNTDIRPYGRAPEHTHTHIPNLHCKLLNLPQVWLQKPMLSLQGAEPGSAAKAWGWAAAGPAPSAPRSCTPHQCGPTKHVEGWNFPSPAAEQSPCMGLMIHSSSTVQSWSCIAALTHEQPVVT